MSGDGVPGLRDDGCPPRRRPSLSMRAEAMEWTKHADFRFTTLVQLRLNNLKEAFRILRILLKYIQILKHSFTNLHLPIYFHRLHIPPTSHTDSLPIHITHQWASHRQHRARRLRRRARPPQRNIQMLLASSSALLRLRYPQRNLLPIRCRYESARLLRSRQSRKNMPESNCVRADTELRTPPIHKSAIIPPTYSRREQRTP